MKTSKRKSRIGSVLVNLVGKTLLVAAILILSVGMAQGSIVVYQEDFDGSSGVSLIGTNPGTVSGHFGTSGASWTGAGDDDFKADGQVVIGASEGNGSVFLPFEPESGYTYTLEVQATWTAPSWLSLGFDNGTKNARPIESGLAWMLFDKDPDARQSTFGGPGTENQDDDGSVDPTSLRTYAVELDMTQGLDSTDVRWLVDGSEIAFASGLNYTDAGTDSLGSIKNVALGSNHGEGDYDSLTLTAIPEPASLGLFGIVCAALWFVRRKFRGMAS